MTGPCILATLTQRHGGTFISIWSDKAEVWVQLTNRYHTLEVAKLACANYGFTLWTKACTPARAGVIKWENKA